MQGQRLVVAHERLVIALQLRQHIAPIDVRRDEVGLDGQRLAETLERLLRPFERLQRAAPIVQRVDRIRIDADRFFHDPFGSPRTRRAGNARSPAIAAR